MDGYVYHIKDPNNTSLDHGYIGVVKKEKGINKRFIEHRNYKHGIMHHHIRENNIRLEDVDVLFEGTIKSCYEYEKRLRPQQCMGWNLAMGGGGPYKPTHEDLKKFRSELQTERMKDEKLKKQQGESFKKNYYSNPKSQELRSRRAREHMADPKKKAASLAGIHKKKKCPYCDLETNPGNLTIHIKAKHNDKTN
jgi:hypothetical protein